MTEEISLSIAETNKLRLKLGLKPIPERDTEAVNAEISKERTILDEFHHPNPGINTALIEAPRDELEPPRKRLKGSNRDTLHRIDVSSFLDDVPDSTDDWLASLGSSSLFKFQPTPTELKNDVLKSDIDNNNNDHSSITVAHSAKELGSLHDDEILTLKDGSIFDDDANQLTSTTLTDKKQLETRLKQQTKVENIKLYGRDNELDEDSDEDDEIFVTSNEIRLTKVEPEDSVEHALDGGKKRVVALTDLFTEIENQEDDPQPNGKVKTKKIKKLKKIKNKEPISKKTSIPAEKIEVVSFDQEEIDDGNDELESFLSSKRKLKQLKRKLLTPEQIAEEIRGKEAEEKQSRLENDLLRSYRDTHDLVFDDTSDFLNRLTAERKEKDIKEGNMEIKEGETTVDANNADPVSNDKNNHVIKDTNESSEEKTTEKNPNDSEVSVDKQTSVDSSTEFTEKINFSSGLASTLKYLQQESGTEQSNLDRIRAKKYRDAQREADKLKLQVSIERRILTEELAKDKVFMNTERGEREKLFEKFLHQRLTEKHILTEDYKKDKSVNLLNYNPEVSIKYKDEDGNDLTAKEAYKELSHKFHGNKPSGSKKRPNKRGSNRNSNVIG